MEYLERAYDDAKYGWYSKRPYLDCAIQSMVDPDMAPPGKAVMSCFVQYAPYHLRESDWDTEKENLGDTVQPTLESFFPGFGDLVLQREIRTPLDIERTVGLSEGNIFAGEFLAPQMFFFRPAPGWSQYRTPIDGYYQCGSGTHPGGCVMGAPGQARGRPDPQGPRGRPGLIASRVHRRQNSARPTRVCQGDGASPRSLVRARRRGAGRRRARDDRREPEPGWQPGLEPGPGPDRGLADRPVLNDAAPGSTVPIGATIWDRVGRTLITGTSLVAHLHPATGKAKATEAILSSDIPGHVSGQIEIPPGGVGELDIGFLGSACTDSGCVATSTGLPIGGTGPPTGAPLPLVAAAEIESPPAGSLVAGRATEVDIVLRPNVPWGDAFTMPDTLVLQVRVPRGPVLLDAPARLIDAASGRYRASVTLPDASQYVLQVASGVRTPRRSTRS